MSLNTRQNLGRSISKAMGMQQNPNPKILTGFRKMSEHSLFEFIAGLYHKHRHSIVQKYLWTKWRPAVVLSCTLLVLLYSVVTHPSFSSKDSCLLRNMTSKYSRNKIPVLKVQIILQLLTQNSQGYNIPLVSTKRKLTKIEVSVRKDLYWEKYSGWPNYDLSSISSKPVCALLYVHLCIAVQNTRHLFLHRLLHYYIYFTSICICDSKRK